MELSDKQITVIFKALCDENRVCACHLIEQLELSQPTLSHHMKILCDSGLVVGRKEGKWMHYSISPQGALNAMKCLSDITSVKSTGSKCCGK